MNNRYLFTSLIFCVHYYAKGIMVCASAWAYLYHCTCLTIRTLFPLRCATAHIVNCHLFKNSNNIIFTILFFNIKIFISHLSMKHLSLMRHFPETSRKYCQKRMNAWKIPNAIGTICYTTLRRNLSVQQNWSGTDQKVRVEDERKMRETGRWGDAGGGAREVVE